MKLTTKKLETSKYAVLADGRATGIYISKGAPAGYREVQEWDVCLDRNDEYLFSAKGRDGCLAAIEKIVAATWPISA